MNGTTTYAQRTGSQPAGARVVAAVPSMRPRRVPAIPMSESPMRAAVHSWQGTGFARFDATNGALGTSTKCPSRPLGPRTT